MLKSRSLTFQISLWGAICLAVLCTCLISYSAAVLKNSAYEKAQYIFIASAQKVAYQIQNKFDAALKTSHYLAQTLIATKKDKPLTRDQVNAILQQILAENPELLGTYTLWEPELFDGNDIQFANTYGHDATGRFIPYWRRDAEGKIGFEPLLHYENPGIGDYYILPRQMHRDCIIPPYLYPIASQSVFLCSLVTPIMIDAKFHGIAGVDLKLEFLQKLAENFNLYDNQAKVFLLSHDGTIAAAAGLPDLIGKKTDATLLAAVFSELAKSEFLLTDGKIYAKFPVTIGETGIQWQVILQVAQSVIYSESNNQINLLIAISVLLASISMILMVVLLQELIIKRIKNIIYTASDYSPSASSKSNPASNGDEIGQLKSLFTDVKTNFELSIAELNKQHWILSATLDNSYQKYGLLDLEGRLISANKSALSMIDQPLEAMQGLYLWDLPWFNISAVEQEKVKNATIEAGKGVLSQTETCFVNSEGKKAYFDFSISPLRNENGILQFLIVEAREITKIKEYSERIRISEERYRHLVENAPLGIFRRKISGEYDFVNLQTAHDFGCQTTQAFLENYGNIKTRWANPEKHEELRQLLLENRQVNAFEIEVLLHDQTRKWFSLYAFLEDDNQSINGFSVDITDQKLIQDNLIFEHDFIKLLFDLSPVFFVVIENNGRVKAINQFMLSALEYTESEVISQNFLEMFVPSEEREHLKSVFDCITDKKKIVFTENSIVSKSGRLINCEWRGIPFKCNDFHCFLGVGLDITERNKIAAREKVTLEQLHQSQKMDAIGQLAGGVAHDFNNMLMGIMGVVEIMKYQECTRKTTLEYLEMIFKTIQRAADLNRKLLTFARKETKISSAINIVDVVAETVAFLKRTIDKAIVIENRNSALSTMIVGDSTMLQNALLNMGINASHAMPDGGRLLFELKNTILDDSYCHLSQFDIKPGNYIEIDVRDTGCGMSPEVQSKIFEPFFTTKERGKGTGLGMSAVYGAVKDHGGAITLYSEIGVGTVFHIYLPLTELARPIIEQKEEHRIGTGTILLVDDEELIRLSAKILLEGMGYTILSAINGKEAVEIYQKAHANIDLVILDMIMPVMGGKETFKQIKLINPDCKIIVSSGFSKDEDLSEMREQGLSGFIYKPFQRNDILSLLAKIIG